jgi:hypothetical protein
VRPAAAWAAEALAAPLDGFSLERLVAAVQQDARADIEAMRVSLRDRFAMAALGGTLAAQDPAFDGFGVYLPKQAAEEAYRYADAMLEERAKTEPAPPPAFAVGDIVEIRRRIDVVWRRSDCRGSRGGDRDCLSAARDHQDPL